MAGQGGACGDEARGATHELDQTHSVGRSHRLDVRAAQDLAGHLERGDEAEAQLYERHVVIDGLGNPDHGLGKTTLLDLLLDCMGAALRAIATNAEQDVDLSRVHEVHHDGRLLRTAGASEHGSTEVMNVSDESLGHEGGLEPRVRVEPSVAVSDPENAANAIVVRELEEPGTDHVVQSRTKSAAGHECRRGFSRIEEKLVPWPRLFEGEHLRLRCVFAYVPLHAHPNRLISKHPAPGLEGRLELAWTQSRERSDHAVSSSLGG